LVNDPQTEIHHPYFHNSALLNSDSCCDKDQNKRKDLARCRRDKGDDDDRLRDNAVASSCGGGNCDTLRKISFCIRLRIVPFTECVWESVT